MKQNSTKLKSNANAQKKAEAEMSAFLCLLSKAKEKKVEHKEVFSLLT